MAENKKGFVLYADLIHTVSQLPNDKAGELLKHILSYVNDENPVTDDLILKIAFEPVKQQLKRDLKKYEEKKVLWSEAGKRSAEVRNANKIERTLTDVDSCLTDSTGKDIVTVKVKDTVKDKVIKIKKPSGIYFPDEELNNLFIEHLKIRSKIKAVNSDKAISGLVSKLNSISSDVREQKQIVEQSIVSSWKSYFPLKNNNNGQIDEAQRRFNKLENLGSSFIPEIKGR